MRQTEPSIIAQGDRIQWTRDFNDYPASLYTHVYRFRGPGNGLNITASANGDAFIAEITAAQSLELLAGRWKWQHRVTKISDATDTATVGSGFLAVEQGFAATTGAVDLRSENKIILEAINAAIKGQATAKQQEYEISTQSGRTKIVRTPLLDLIKARDVYAGLVQRENIRERMKNGDTSGQSRKIRMFDNG